MVLAGFVITVGVSVPAGFQASIINAPAEYIQRWCRAVIWTRFGVWLPDAELNLLWASVVTVAIFFAMISSIFGGVLSCKLGRLVFLRSSTFITIHRLQEEVLPGLRLCPSTSLPLLPSLPHNIIHRITVFGPRNCRMRSWAGVRRTAALPN